MTVKRTVKLTGNVERNLAEQETFLVEAEAPQAFDALLDELTETVIPNLESFPGHGAHVPGSSGSFSRSG